MTNVPLYGTDKVAIVDDEDAGRVLQWEWYLHSDYWTEYAHRWEYDANGKRIRITLHHYILPNSEGRMIDHMNHNGLDNRKANLRIATPSQSNANRKKWGGTSSKYKGVSLRTGKKTKPWAAYIRTNYNLKHLGFYATEEEAAKAYDSAAAMVFGEFACLNFPEAA